MPHDVDFRSVRNGRIGIQLAGAALPVCAKNAETGKPDYARFAKHAPGAKHATSRHAGRVIEA
jgi:hypothetical protein